MFVLLTGTLKKFGLLKCCKLNTFYDYFAVIWRTSVFCKVHILLLISFSLFSFLFPFSNDRIILLVQACLFFGFNCTFSCTSGSVHFDDNFDLALLTSDYNHLCTCLRLSAPFCDKFTLIQKPIKVLLLTRRTVDTFTLTSFCVGLQLNCTVVSLFCLTFRANSLSDLLSAGHFYHLLVISFCSLS